MTPFLSLFAACTAADKTFFGIPTWYKYLKGKMTEEIVEGRAISCSFITDKNNPNAFSFPGDIGLIALGVLDIALHVAGLVAVAFVMYGGFRFITSQGEPDASKKARQTIINGIIGMVIALFASVIVAFIGTRIG